MYFINNHITDPYFNLASEEYLLKEFDEDIFMLWQNDRTIVLGKHQNAFSEINYSFVKRNNLKVARRISGGGTVYHDLGNLNFTFISTGEPGKLVDYKKQIAPVINALLTLGIPAVMGSKNEILVDGKKISGNAEHVYRNRVLHHGTLLFSCDLNMMNMALKVNPKRFVDKAVQSNRSTVINISEIIHTVEDMDKFREKIYNYIRHIVQSSYEYVFSDRDRKKIDQLSEEKYATWEWIYGYSPDYSMRTKIVAGSLETSIEIFVKKGYIRDIQFPAPTITPLQKNMIMKTLTGLPHKEEVISESMNSNLTRLESAGIDPEKFLRALF